MNSNKTCHRERIAILCFVSCCCMMGMIGRLFFLMVFKSEHYSQMAQELHERERSIKAARGNILDVNGTVIATNRTVCTISVIHNQVKNQEQVIEILTEKLGISREEIRKKVEKRSSREIIKTNVTKEIGDQIRSCALEGVKV
ncbi:MAG: peptidoglycan glycosyltransferase, partial [Hungatella sp.]